MKRLFISLLALLVCATTINAQHQATLTLGDVQIKDISTPNQYKVKIKNSSQYEASVQFQCYGQPTFVLQPGEQGIFTLNTLLFDNVEVVILERIVIQWPNNFEYSRFYGVIILNK